MMVTKRMGPYKMRFIKSQFTLLETRQAANISSKHKAKKVKCRRIGMPQQHDPRGIEQHSEHLFAMLLFVGYGWVMQKRMYAFWADG